MNFIIRNQRLIKETRMRIIFVIVISLFGGLDICYSQIINGFVLDENDSPISYVNIGIINKNYGTISLEDGSFELSISQLEDNDIIRFSSIGYNMIEIKGGQFREKDFKKNITIKMQSKLYPIGEVIINPQKMKVFTIGAKKPGNTSWAWYNLMNGAEIGRLFRNTREIYLQKFYFHVSETNCDSILYRLKVYSIIDNMPQYLLNQDNIYFVSKEPKGWVQIDLINYDLRTQSDFIITLETIKGWNSKHNKNIYLSKVQKKGLSYKRASSWASWMSFEGEMSYKLEVSEINGNAK